jgi:hypothetical protein
MVEFGSGSQILRTAEGQAEESQSAFVIFRLHSDKTQQQTHLKWQVIVSA